MDTLSRAEKIAQLKIFLAEIKSLNFENDDWDRLYDLSKEIKLYSVDHVSMLENNARLNHDRLSKITVVLSKEDAKIAFEDCKRNCIIDLTSVIDHL